jgi:hypothetical protein
MNALSRTTDDTTFTPKSQPMNRTTMTKKTSLRSFRCPADEPRAETPRASQLTRIADSTSLRREVPTKKCRRVLTPKTLFHGLARELALLGSVYAKLRADHPALYAYPTLPRLLERITVGPRDDAKKELIASLIAIRQSSPHRLWVAILLRAFRPMLAKLWKELFGSDGQERFALLLLGFQAAIGHVNPTRDPVRIGMYVRQATRRRAILALSKELSWSDVGFGEDADECADTRKDDTRKDDARARRRSLEPLLRGSALQTYVRRAYPTLSSEEQTREYQRLRRRLRRAVMAPSAGRESQAVTR